MDFLKKVASEAVNDAVNSNKNNSNDGNGNGNSNSNGNTGENKIALTVMGQLNNVLGGGEKAEKKEDILDKAIDVFQEHVLKAGPQNNESAIEQAKDAQIASAIRSGYKTTTGKDFPV